MPTPIGSSKSSKNEHVEVLALQEVSWDLLNRLNGAGIAIICRIPWPRSKRGMTTAV